MPFVNGAPLDATGKIMVTTVTPTAAWPSRGGMTYHPTTGELAVKDAVPLATEPRIGGIAFTNLGQMYVTTVLPSPLFYDGGLPVSSDGRLFMSSNPPVGSVGGWPIGSDGGISGVGLGPVASFFAPLMTTLVPTTAGNPTFTFARAALAYAMDFEGILRQASQNEARFQGARRVRNLVSVSSQDFSAGGWTRSNCTVTFGATGPTGLADANTVTATGATGTFYQLITATPTWNRSTSSCWIRRRTGSGIVNIIPADSVRINITSQLTSAWQRIAAVASLTTINLYVGLEVLTAGDAIDVAYMQVEQVDGQSNQAPSEYVSVGVLAAPYHGNWIDGVKYFGTTNGNAVVTNLAPDSTTLNGWNSDNSTWATDGTLAPNGSATALKFRELVINSWHRIYRGIATFTAGQPHTFSLHIKADSLPWIQILIYDGSTYRWGNFNPTTGLVGNKDSGTTAVMTPLPNGWYRISVTATVAATSGEIHIYTSNSDVATSRPVYLSTGQSMYIWGPQLELGAVVHAYVPTPTSSPVTALVEATGTPIPLATTLGYVAENAATNLCTASQTFDDATATGWTKNDAVIAPNDATVAAPDGTLTADKFTDNATNAFHRVFSAAISLASQPNTFSVYIKAGTLTWAQLVGTNGFWANFNLVTGALGNKHASATSSIVALPNGWYRCIITGTGTNFNAQVVSLPSDLNAVTPAYAGTSQTMFLWGAQVETGSDPSSYIATTTVAVVRNGDALDYPMVSNLDGALGTTYSETYQLAASAGNQQALVSLSSTFHPQYLNASKSLGIYSGIPVFTANVRSLAAINKNASAWSAATTSVCLNGGAIGAGGFTTIATSGTVRMGYGSGLTNLGGTIRNVKFYNVRIADADLITMTSGDPFFANVELLLHFEGADGSTTITDSSPSPKSVVASSTCALSTARAKFGASSALGGSTGYFTATLGAGGNMTGDFTWETWIWGGGNNVVFYSNGGGYLYADAFKSYGGPDLTVDTTLTAAWHHLAISRVGSNLYGFTDGVLMGTVTYAGTVDLQTLVCGKYVPNGNLFWTDNYDEMRVTKGVGRYTATFTPPTAPFPNF